MHSRRPVVVCLLSFVVLARQAAAETSSGTATASAAALPGTAAENATAGVASVAAEVLSLEERSDAEDGRGLSGLVNPYLWDGGALPFIWGALAARIAMDRYLPSRSSPLGFSSDEGGAQLASWETPGWAVTATGGALGLAMALGDNQSRWYHVKGLAQSLATGSVVTAGLKLTFARQRPDWSGDASNGFGGGNRSFPSGHSTQAFQIATYAALYLRLHGFDRFRPHGSFRWWEGVAYAGIFGAAAAVAGERVYHNRHHLSDVAAGAALGTATSTIFFLYQERRYKRSRDRERRMFLMTPRVSGEDIGVSAQWTY
jgi:membrane-associated phospholipid phosphatase